MTKLTTMKALIAALVALFAVATLPVACTATGEALLEDDTEEVGSSGEAGVGGAGDAATVSGTGGVTLGGDPVEMVIKHLLDSLVISPYLHGETLLDVGCGAGLPSLPLALTQPQRSFTLVDSNHKKIAFVNEVKRKLALTNVTAIHARVEDLGCAEHHSIICRAFTALPRFLDLTAPLLAVDGRWLAMKGANPQRELSEVSDRYLVDEVVPLTVPELSAERHLVVVRHRA